VDKLISCFLSVKLEICLQSRKRERERERERERGGGEFLIDKVFIFHELEPFGGTAIPVDGILDT
jgi:hypothetical protein